MHPGWKSGVSSLTSFRMATVGKDNTTSQGPEAVSTALAELCALSTAAAADPPAQTLMAAPPAMHGTRQGIARACDAIRYIWRHQTDAHGHGHAHAQISHSNPFA